ncbi:MAG: NADPH:quinone reductase [Pirellula sp.]
MKAAYFRKTGAPDVIEFGDLPEPMCGPDQVKVKVSMVSVNPIDTYIRNGANYWPLPNPYILGCDLAGEIVAIGSQIKQLAIGQRVWASNQGLMGRQGTFAEYAVVDPKWLHPSPDSVEDQDLAAVALVGITAHLGLFQRADLQPDETLFVRGGTGGVGSAVVQMAKAVGATVITSAGSQTKVDRCLELGADHAFNYNDKNTVDEIHRIAPAGVNVFWETLRDPDFDLAVSSMCENGRMVLMAGRDARPAFPVGPFYVKGCSLHGFAMFKASAEEQQVAASDINHWLTMGQLKPQIDRILPLSQAAEAHRLQEAHTVHKQSLLAGKIVLDVRGNGT